MSFKSININGMNTSIKRKRIIGKTKKQNTTPSCVYKIHLKQSKSERFKIKVGKVIPGIQKPKESRNPNYKIIIDVVTEKEH